MSLYMRPDVYWLRVLFVYGIGSDEVEVKRLVTIMVLDIGRGT